MKRHPIPDDFAVTDEHRAYCAKHGYPDPAVFLEDFRLHFGANGKPLVNWSLALYAWIRNEAPGGRFHNLDRWKAFKRAAERLHPQPQDQPQAPAPRGTERQGPPPEFRDWMARWRRGHVRSS